MLWDNFMFCAVMLNLENCKGTLERSLGIEFVAAPLSESEKDFEDDFIQKLQDSVKEVKESREMGARYMTFQDIKGGMNKAETK